MDEFTHTHKVLILATIGGMVAYLMRFHKKRETDKEHEFSILLLLINAITGGFLGYLVGSAIPETYASRDFIIGLTGVLAYPILTILESNIARILGKILSIVLTEKIELKD